MQLWRDFLTHTGRPIHKWKHYFPAYERHFGRFVGQPLTMVEIGCGRGGSLQLWKRYFGPHATLVGLDISPYCKTFEEDQIHVRIGDQGDPDFLRRVVEEFGTPDIVLDDGSHRMGDVVTSFRTLYPLLARTGVYLVEDLHTAYMADYDGGLKRPGTFIELAKDLIDELNADLSGGAVAPTEFGRTTLSMHIYDSIIAFEKGPTTGKSAPMIPPAT